MNSICCFQSHTGDIKLVESPEKQNNAVHLAGNPECRTMMIADKYLTRTVITSVVVEWSRAQTAASQIAGAVAGAQIAATAGALDVGTVGVGVGRHREPMTPLAADDRSRVRLETGRDRAAHPIRNG